MSKRDSKEEYNAYMREYMLKRYYEKRSHAIIALGGKCVKCNSIHNLEIDHINTSSKTGEIGKLWSYSLDKFVAELIKCQLLCEECHKDKSILDRGMKSAKNTHGTLSSYRYCKCTICVKAKSDYPKSHKKK